MYLSRRSLADKLDLAEGAIDQLVKRGILPEPVTIGEAKRWRWDDVDARLRGVAAGVAQSADEQQDPYLAGVAHVAVAQAAAARVQRHKQAGQVVHLPPAQPRHGDSG
jgi:predicted DNA-binding transcriptional regulator AlpA